MSIDELRHRMRARAQPRNTRWYEISNQDGDKAVLRIFDEIHWLFGVDADTFAADLEAITAPEIEVQINSPGGDVFDGIAIYNQLRAHPARITTRVDGIAASIASVIVQAGDRRTMLSGSQLMIHEAWGLAIGPAEDHRAMADLLDRQTANIVAIYAERSGRPADDLRTMVVDETWLTAQEAVDAGLADEVMVPQVQDSGPTLRDEIAGTVDAVTQLVESAERVAALRAEAGKTLSNANRDSLAELRALNGRLDALLTTEHQAGDTPADSSLDADVRHELLRFVATTRGAPT